MAYKVEAGSAQRYQPLIEWETLPDGRAPATWEVRALVPDEVPKRGILVSAHKKLPDMFEFKGSLVVCEAFREIVESLEPGVHQFFPFKVVTKKGRPVAGNGPYYVFNARQKFDAILVGKSNIVWSDLNPERSPGVKIPRRGPGPLRLVMSRPQIADRHIWRSERMFHADLYFSDKLVEDIQAANLQGLNYVRIEESDEEWHPEGNLTPD